MPLRILYVTGHGNIIEAHEHWRKGKEDPSQMFLIYSGQFEDMCQEIDATAYLISPYSDRRLLRDGRFTLEHRPKPIMGGGLLYHLSEILYGFGLVATALRFRADLAVISSGTTHYFMLAFFRLFGIRVISVLHNTLWPKGYPPTRLVPRMIFWLDGLFFRWVCSACIGISAECTRQVDELSGGNPPPLYLMRAQFRRDYFQAIAPTPPIDLCPFTIVFAGRAERNKGVFDLLEMAQRLEQELPGRFRWEVCGSGADLDELRRQHEVMGLQPIVSVRGWTSPADLRAIQGRSHLSIVPTRSDFAEGMAKTAIEAVLASRPVLTSSVNPALDVLRPAAIEAETDNVGSYVDAIKLLIDDEDRYNELVEACQELQDQFYDGVRGFDKVLKQSIFDTALPGSTPAKP
jgi:glycogen synthase